MVLHSGPNGFSFLFPYKLSILARGKTMFETGVGKRFGKRDGSQILGGLECQSPRTQLGSSREVQHWWGGSPACPPRGAAAGLQARGPQVDRAGKHGWGKATDVAKGRGSGSWQVISRGGWWEEAVFRESSDVPQVDLLPISYIQITVQFKRLH